MKKLIFSYLLFFSIGANAQWNFWHGMSNTCQRIRPTCQAHFDAGCKKSGNYKITINNQTTIVRCEQEIAGGGWIVLQARNADTNFYRTWAEYKAGFTNDNTNLWLGLENFYQLTKTSSKKMAVYVEQPNGTKGIAYYSGVQLDSEATYYKLKSLGTYSYENSSGYVDPLDALTAQHLNQRFSTYDNEANSQKCATICSGAWWYNACYASNLNGRYFYNASTNPSGGYSYGSCPNGNEWRAWVPNVSMKKTIMMIK